MTVLFREQDDKEAPDARLLVNVESDKAGRTVIYILLSIYTKYHFVYWQFFAEAVCYRHNVAMS